MEKMSKQEYGNLAKKASPNTESWISIPWAFMVGGLICTLGQGLINLWEYMGLSEEMAPTAASVTLVLLSALTTGLNVYDKLANKAGAGTLVPITGFANAVASPALEFKSEERDIIALRQKPLNLGKYVDLVQSILQEGES